MATLQPTDAADARRLEAARKAARTVALALRAHRQYSAGHTLTQQALLTAQDAVRSYAAAFGPLTLAPAGRGLRFGFTPTLYEDDAAAVLNRALTAASVGDLRLNAGAGAADLAELADVLHLPRSALARAGGAGKLLQERGVQTISLVDLGSPPPAHASAGDIDVLVDTLRETPDQLAARLQESSRGEAAEAARLLQQLDRIIAVWRRVERDEAWTLVAGAIMGIAPALRTQLCRIIASSLREPWAASIASRWPPVLFGGIVASAADAAPQEADEVASALRKLHRGPAPAAIPPVDGPGDPQVRRSLEGMGGPAQRIHAAVAFLNVLARLDTTRFEDGLRVVERGILGAVESEDVETIGQILTGLAALTHRLADVRADLARVALHRALTTAVRDLVSRSLSERAGESHPLRQAMAAAPEESVPLLLDLLADEERLPVRREIVSLLAVLARTQLPLLAQYLGDSRWYVARNVVTALAEMRDPALVPYLRAAVQHRDVRVRREALQALGGLNTPDALAALEAALHHPDAETRTAAAHWVRVAKTPGAGA